MIQWARTHTKEVAEMTANRLAYADQYVTREAAVKRYEEIILAS